MRFKIELTNGKFTPSSTPEYHITFHFKFELKISEFIVNQGSETLTRHTNETINDSARVVFKFDPNRTAKEVAKIFANDTSESISTILGCLPIRVSDNERLTLIDFAIKEARQAVRNSMHDDYEAVDLYMLVRMEGREAYDPFDEASESCCMVPAAESAVRLLLKECGEGEIGRDHDRSCCICHEELGERAGADVALLSMPCQHVFHGDCIEKWLRSSHYCPLCRFEMPTEEIDFWVIE